MGPPFLAYYGALKNDWSLLQLAFDNIRLFRDALLVEGPTGPLWGHIYSEDNGGWVDKEERRKQRELREQLNGGRKIEVMEEDPKYVANSLPTLFEFKPDIVF